MDYFPQILQQVLVKESMNIEIYRPMFAVCKCTHRMGGRKWVGSSNSSRQMSFLAVFGGSWYVESSSFFLFWLLLPSNATNCEVWRRTDRFCSNQSTLCSRIDRVLEARHDWVLMYRSPSTPVQTYTWRTFIGFDRIWTSNKVMENIDTHIIQNTNKHCTNSSIYQLHYHIIYTNHSK